MNKDAIRQTAILRFDEAEGCFVMESPLCDFVVGAAKTEPEARQLFAELLEETYASYKKGALYEYKTPGRPAKHKATLNTRIHPDVKQQLDEQARLWGISKGEVIEYLFAAHQARIAK